ncbi:unnamed protein product [Cyprideis torosa]|uniref:Uncharacterized protein n=1 Tax=Cyprideis torosa TaxID=163714 RepID=A0A7R8ZQ66_9CRUS|nr:unnamed protein product [Cyprideis torosa]CAG0889956.1 unnamed protein product [Cyprideis torosa]
MSRSPLTEFILVCLLFSVTPNMADDDDRETCRMVPKTIHLTKDELNVNGRLERTCVEDTAVNKCEGTCFSEVHPSIKMPTGFLKNCFCCRETSLRDRKVKLSKCYDTDGVQLAGEKGRTYVKFLQGRKSEGSRKEVGRKLEGRRKEVQASEATMSLAAGMIFLGGLRGNLLGSPEFRELQSAFGFPSSLDEFRRAMVSLRSCDEAFLVARLFFDFRIPVSEWYKQQMRSIFSVEIGIVDFQQNHQKAAQEMDDWLKKTYLEIYGKDIRYLGDIDVNETSKIVLLNRIFLESRWENTFTRDSDTMMHVRGSFRAGHVEELEATVVEVPCKKNRRTQVMFTAFYPDKKEALGSLAMKLTPEVIRRVRRNLPKKNILLQMPEFRNSVAFESPEHLRKLGVGEIFEKEANLGGIIERTATKRQDAFVTQFQHIHSIRVTAEGVYLPGPTYGFDEVPIKKNLVKPDILLRDNLVYLVSCEPI